jgi:hypothetical protein
MIRRGGRTGAAGAALALIEPVTVAVHVQDMDGMGQPVQPCTGEPNQTRGSIRQTAGLR